MFFWRCHAVMEPTWGDLPTLAQGGARSTVQGRVGATVIPGTTEAFNPATGQWDKYPLNVVGNTNGGSWHCVISRLSEEERLVQITDRYGRETQKRLYAESFAA